MMDIIRRFTDSMFRFIERFKQWLMTNPQHEHCDEHQQDTWFYNDELPTMIQVDISFIPIYQFYASV